MTIEQRQAERRCQKDRRARHAHNRRGAGERRWWLSPGAALWLTALSCALALILIFLVVPFYRDRGARNDREQQAALVRASQRRQGAALLHGFDCTYGQGIRLTLKEAARSSTVSAHVALQARHNAILRGDRRAAHRSLISYRNSTRAAARYRHVAASLRPLGLKDRLGRPIPPCTP